MSGESFVDDARILRWTWGDDPSLLVSVLDDGGVVAIPSESSYGLAVDPRNPGGVEAVYRVKDRDRGKPLPVVAADPDQLRQLGIDPRWPPLARVAAHWPAALSLAVPLDPPIPAMAGGPTLALRVPAHPLVRSLLAHVGCPWTATSANLAGESPILDPDDLEPLLRAALDRGLPRAAIIDDGTLPGGPPSTLVSWDDAAGTYRVLRPGRFDPAQL